MKTRNLMVAVLLTAGSFTMSSFAQENIKALIQKCENMDNVELNIVRNKGTSQGTQASSLMSSMLLDSKEIGFISFFRPGMVVRSITTVTLKSTPAFEKELVAAFHKDREKAIQEIEQKKDGKITHMHYQFENGDYSFTVKNDTLRINAVEGDITPRRQLQQSQQQSQQQVQQLQQQVQQ